MQTAPMSGIVPSLNTPFTPDGDVDHPALARLVHHTVDAGCGGMLGLAVAGEQATLTAPEKTQCIETLARANAGRIALVVSVTAADIAVSEALAQQARDAGATGICVQLPDHADRTESLRFLNRLARAAPPQMMVQDLDWHGPGLSLEDIVYLFDAIEAFDWLKIETQGAGPKYSAVLEATDGALNVCGGWAVTQLMDAMARGVHAFIPTGLEHVYVAIHRLYAAGREAEARAIFDQVLPILNFSNQHIDVSIRFFKELRRAEGLFATDLCRSATARFDPIQRREADHALARALDLIHAHGPRVPPRD